MAILATPGQTISFADINTALGRSPTASISLNDTELRTTAQNVTSEAPINMYDHIAGKGRCKLTISSNTTGYDLKAQCDNDGYVAGKTYVSLVINADVYVGGNNSGTGLYTTDNWALNVNGFTTGDTVNITNNGFILGKGGTGGGTSASPGGLGGNAVRIGFAGVTIINNGTIKGGGGGGAGGRNGSIRLGGKFNQYTGFAQGGLGGGGAGYPGGSGVASFTFILFSNSPSSLASVAASSDGTTLLGGAASSWGGTSGTLATNGGNGGDVGQAGTSTYATEIFGYVGASGYPIGLTGYGGNPGWSIYYDAYAIQTSATLINNAAEGSIGGIGWGGVYG